MQELVAHLRISRDRLRRRFLPILIRESLVQLTNPDNPKYMYQHYALTANGHAILALAVEKGGK